MPSPGKIIDGIVTNAVSGLHRPLVSRQRMEDQETQRARQTLVQRSTISELSAMKNPFDIPLPKFKSSKRSKSEEDKKGKKEKKPKEEDR